MKSLKILTFSLFLIVITISAQAQKRALKKADAAFASGEYFKAYELYEKAMTKLKVKKEKGVVAFKLGECSREMNKPKKCKKWYKKAIVYKYKEPLAVLYYADALKIAQDYENASLQYLAYKDMVPEDERGTNGATSCEEIQSWIATPTFHIITELKTINSKKSDFSPSFGENLSEIYMTSTRNGANGTDKNSITGENFADIFFTKKDRKGKWSEPVPVEGGVNSPQDEGASCVIADGGVIYFTRCKQEKDNAGCRIYRANKTAGEWGEAKLVELSVDSLASIGHPAVSQDEMTMYFVSDMKKKGHKGGRDIWVSKRKSASGKWSIPVNAGSKINTKGDELFPFIRENGELYFSSNGKMGMGGLDIYKATPKGSSWEVENMKYPLNSPHDDFGMVWYKDQKKGLFASTRKKRDNLYYFALPELSFKMKGIVKDSKTGEPIPGASITLLGKDDGSKSEIKSASDGTFRFKLGQRIDYSVTASKKKFLKAIVEESTKGLKESKVIEVVLEIISTTDEIPLPNIEYAIGSHELREESKVSLDKLVKTLNVNSNITIELSANTDFRGSDQANLELSQRRAQSVVDYLISKEIKADRLTPKGNGEAKPKVVNETTARTYDFLKEGDILTEEFILKLTKEQQDTANQLNRRTEFSVLSDDYGVINNQGFGTEPDE